MAKVGPWEAALQQACAAPRLNDVAYSTPQLNGAVACAAPQPSGGMECAAPQVACAALQPASVRAAIPRHWLGVIIALVGMGCIMGFALWNAVRSALAAQEAAGSLPACRAL